MSACPAMVFDGGGLPRQPDTPPPPQAATARGAAAAMPQSDTLPASDLARNLRLLCSYGPSVSEICRRLGINRQQFTKYLNGTARPADRNLRRICDHFGVEMEEILSPPGRFAAIVSVSPPARALLKTLGPVAHRLDRLIANGAAALERYAGYYFYYYNTPSRPGHLRRSLLRVTAADGVAHTRLVERVQPAASPLNRSHFSDCAGLMLMIDHRLFIVELNIGANSSVSQTILYPAQGRELRYLSGLTIGVQGRSARAPFSTRVFLEFMGKSPNVRALMRQTGLFELDHPDLPAHIPALIAAPKLERFDVLKAYELLP